MKQCLAILLFLCVSCQLVAKIGFITWFEANRSYVAKELCENKDQPQKKCAGKCYLKKQLNKIEQEPSGENSEQAKKHKVETIEFLPCIAVTTQVLFFEINNVPADRYVNNYKYIASTAVFHPPAYC